MLMLCLATAILYISKVDLSISGTFTIITLIVIYRHKDNIKRIRDGNENKITWM